MIYSDGHELILETIFAILVVGIFLSIVRTLLMKILKIDQILATTRKIETSLAKICS